MTRFLLGLAKLLAGCVLFAWFAFVLLPAAIDQEIASGALTERGSDWAAVGAISDAPAVGETPVAPRSVSACGASSVSTSNPTPVVTSCFQGKTARWWARRAVQARKDANKRQQTIFRLRRELARSGPSWGWLANADCIYREERGADGWATNTGNGYFGGMQADRSFQRTYAPFYYRRWGTANYWPWWAQLHMAFNGWLARGWQPWPNTSRECGLR